MIKLLIAFVIFAGVIYYYNLDLIALVNRSGIPVWLVEHGYSIHKEAATSTLP